MEESLLSLRNKFTEIILTKCKGRESDRLEAADALAGDCLRKARITDPSQITDELLKELIEYNNVSWLRKAFYEDWE